MICRRQLLLAILQQALQRLDTLITCNQLALGNGDLLLQGAVLLHELPLHDGELLEVAFKEHHFLLLCAVVGSAKYVVVLLSRFVQRDLKFNDL